MFSLFVLCRLMIVLIWRAAACDCGNASSTDLDFPLIEGCIFNSVLLCECYVLRKVFVTERLTFFFFFFYKSINAEVTNLCRNLSLSLMSHMQHSHHLPHLLLWCRKSNPPPQIKRGIKKITHRLTQNNSNHCWGWNLNDLYFYESPPTKSVLMELHCGTLWYIVDCISMFGSPKIWIFKCEE